MDDEKLIEFVRKYEFLYNLKHPKYMDTTRKELAWKEIAELLQQSAAACKERWQNLRDAFRRALSKKKGRSGQAGRNTKPWKYENEMAFVVPFFVKRKTQEAMENKSEGDESDNCTDDQHHSIDQYHSNEPYLMKKESPGSMEIKIEDEEYDNYTDDRSFDIAADDVVYNSDDKNSLNENNYIKEKSKARKRKIIDSEKSPATLKARITDPHKPKTFREHNELDSFFLNISDTVKTFPLYQQALAKNKIFNLVSEMELQQLAPPQAESTSSK